MDINRRVLDGSYSVFHCACLSCSLELVRALLPLADLQLTTARGDSALYLAVYAAAHRLATPSLEQPGLGTVPDLCSLSSTIIFASHYIFFQQLNY